MAKEKSEDKQEKRPINILLIEDSEADVKIALRAFHKVKQESKIFVVNNGEEALDFIHNAGQYQDKDKNPTPDIILLDINMPKMDGFGFLKSIKNDLEYSHIPVIMLTTSKNEEDVAKSYKYGATSYIQKPVSYEDFINFVDGFNFYWQSMKKKQRPEGLKE